MQQILNSQERNQAFLKFLLFFLVTVILVIAAVFFNYRVPFAENKWMQGQVDIQHQVDANQQKFAIVMVEADSLLTMRKNPGVNTAQIDGQIKNKLDQLNGLAQSSNTSVGKMNQVVYDKMYENLSNLTKIQTQADQITKLQDDINRLRNELNDAHTGSATSPVINN